MRKVVVIVALLLLAALAYAQSPFTFYEVNLDVGPLGGGFAKLVDSNFVERSEVYLGDVLYLLLDLRDFGDVDVGVTIVDESPFGTRTYTGTLRGGRVWGLQFSIVEPICDGCIYTMRIRACSIWTCKSDTVSWVERWYPPVAVRDVRVLYGSSPTSRLVVGKEYVVEVVVENMGQRGYEYTVVVESKGGHVPRVSKSVWVGAGAYATVRLTVKPQSYPAGYGDTLVVSVYGAKGPVGDRREINVEIVPPRPGPFVVASVSGGRLVESEEGRVVVTLTNMGWGGRFVDVKVSPAFSAAASGASYPQSFGPGANVTLSFSITPRESGRRTVELVLTYEGDDGSQYTERHTLDLYIYVRVRVGARDHLGYSLGAACVEVNGSCVGDVVVDPALLVRIRASEVVDLGVGARAVFLGWSDGTGGAVREERFAKSVSLVANYERQYRVVVVDRLGKASLDQWVRAGDAVYISPPSYVEEGGGSRWRLAGVSGCGVGRVVVDRPLQCTVEWVKQFYVEVLWKSGDRGGTCRADWVDAGSQLRLGAEACKPREEAGERYVFEGWDLGGRRVESPDFAIDVSGPVRAVANFRRQFRVVVEDGVGGTSLDKWVDEGGSVELNPPKYVDAGSGSRWVFKGYEGGCSVGVNRVFGPLSCRAEWGREYRVEVVAELEGRRDVCFADWVAEGSALSFSVDRCRPGDEGLGPLVRVVFREWRGFGQSKNVSFTVDRPMEVVAVYGRDYTGLVLAVAGGAAVGGVFGYRQWKERTTVTRTRRVERMSEEPTQTYGVETRRERGDVAREASTMVYKAEDEEGKTRRD